MEKQTMILPIDANNVVFIKELYNLNVAEMLPCF